jgi:glycyl-tRNA synthetase
VEQFTDPLSQCASCATRVRADKVLEEAGHDGPWDGQPAEALAKAIQDHGIACPSCGATGDAGLGKPRAFNLLFETAVGAVADDAATSYLRPETAQGAFVHAASVLAQSRAVLPMGLAQVGKAFRNEIAVGQGLFRTREFEQAEIQLFCNASDSAKIHREWVGACNEWLTNAVSGPGLLPELVRRREHEESELAHYALATTDLEFRYPFGWGELWGIANRGDYDLQRHAQASGQDMRYRDPKTQSKEASFPHAVEPSLGIGRLFLATMCSSLHTEMVEGAGGKQTERVVLRVPDAVAPRKAAVLPLMKNKGMPDVARAIAQSLRVAGGGVVDFDEAGSIGKRYRRQDEVGTPMCVTVDHTTLEDGSVTVRCRDSLRQARVTADELTSAIGPMGLTRARLPQDVFTRA